MSDIRLSLEAKKRLDLAIEQYKDQILSKLYNANIGYLHDVTLEDMEYAIKAIAKQRELYDSYTRKRVRLNRLLWIVFSCFSMSSIILLILVFVEKHESAMRLEFMSELLTYVSVAVSLLSLILVSCVTYKNTTINTKAQVVGKFIDRWDMFERLLRVSYAKTGDREPSFIDLMQYFIENHVCGIDDFRTVLALRNRLVHNKSAINVSLDDIKDCIGKLDQLILAIRGH